MKRFTLIMALVLSAAMPTFAERVNSETARNVAFTFLSNNGAKTNHLTDLSKEVGFPNLYIFAAEKGFVIMAADDCVQPILGYSLTDIVSTEDMPENLAWWLQGYNDEIQAAVDSKMKASSETAKMWKDLAEGNAKAGRATAAVAPLIQTKWNQNKYYNHLCPAVSDGPDGHAYTGCGATAMAQIMKYWNYPSSGIGSNSYTWNGQTLSANFGATTYDWDNMNPYYEYYFANGEDPYANGLPEPSEEQLNAVATLMYHCGISVNMNYGGNSTGGSSAYTNALAPALINYFNYSSSTEFKQKSYTNLSTGQTYTYYSDSEWTAMLKVELNASRPVQYCGSDPNSSGGHAFVCDGYDSNDYFHFNWGWAGRYDGYFTISNLDTGANSSQAGAGNGNYSRNQSAVFGIEPATMIPAPTNLTYTLNGLRDITLTWDAVSVASSYNVYRNGSLIGNATGTTYSETAPFGTHEYYIRSVDANSQLSLTSNTISVTIAYQTPIVNDLTATLSGNNINLSWTAPEWCYPETSSANLTYGADTPYSSVGTGSTGNPFYWGNRHLASDLTEYNGKMLYKVSFYATGPNAYECFIFKGTSVYDNTYYYPNEELAHYTVVASSIGWTDILFDEPIEIDSSEDLWVFLYDPEGRAYPASYSIFSEHINGGYWSYYYPNAAVSGWLLSTYSNAAFLIKAHITDGTYTYNLYRNGTALATNLSTTSYTDQNRNNTAGLYTVKTNYYGGETTASNGVGYALGQASMGTLTLNANDQMTVAENSKLTVSGTLSDVNAANLILENGAQLVNNSTGVQATMKRNIIGYTGDEGWYTISAPFASLVPSTDNGLINGNYDLYAYDEDGDADGKEWINFKEVGFNIVPSSGYLYANSATQALSLSGELNSGTYSRTVNLSYNNATENLKGFNLIGNPTAHEISFTKSSNVSDGYYYIDNGGDWVYTTSNSVPVGRGFLVKANATGQSVTLNQQSKGEQPEKDQYLRFSIGNDNAYVKLSEGVSMPLMSFNGTHSSIYLLSNREPYAMLVHNDAEAIDLCFEARRNETQTITVDANNLGLDYLHLIDNLTGNDIDLLATPSYTFEAKRGDYTTRFKLLFAPICEENANDESFAFISNGNIILNNTEATLQIVDMTGRVVVEKAATNRISTNEMTAGVYVLRLIDRETVRTQKIVIE